ncbi:unnamed protein product [Acanthoscelides obtectus]|uniref:PiggyBac transposable element-derived protein domain-containing protein n=1 Tax=Acanthoscelides obtectus TaxID=200917 RepID=A0A9P0LLL3_ACAOB|nr:unnamed protein product [Acanthoscelides obtectus]CAK1683277.1 hypothetical protein AOBTE_LOCUS34181 [Acanthoscelides obtectus]
MECHKMFLVVYSCFAKVQLMTSSKAATKSIGVKSENVYKYLNKSKHNDLDWQKCNPEYSIWSEPPPLCEINANRDKLVDEINDLNPVQLFELFFDDTVLRHIVDQSMLFASQNTRHQRRNEILHKFEYFPAKLEKQLRCTVCHSRVRQNYVLNVPASSYIIQNKRFRPLYSNEYRYFFW